MKFIRLICVLVFLLSLFSCEKERGEADNSIESFTLIQDYSSILIPISQVPLFADLSKYNLLPHSERAVTRVEEETVSLESLLDREAAKTVSFKGAKMTLIPFLQNKEEVWACLGDSPEIRPEIVTCVKKYFVSTANENFSGSFVVSMITGSQYYQTHPMFDYFDMPNYTGAILYSSLEGEFKEARVYKGGQIKQSVPIVPEADLSDSTDAVYITLGDTTPPTRQDLGGYITPAICTGLGVKPGWNWINPAWCFGMLGSTGGGAGSNGGNTLSGGGSGNGNDQQSEDSVGEQLLPNLPPIGIECEVNVFTNIPKYVKMLGSGRYPFGSQIPIGYELTMLVYSEPEFTYWTGAFEKKKEPEFLYTVTSDVESTAYFEVPAPCGDDEKGLTNPLKEMRIAATKSGSYINGTFNAFRGYKKDGVTPKYHQGVDFYAIEGTPTFAMASGRIVRVMADAPDHESSYNGSWGNAITIKCDVAIDSYADDENFGNARSVYFQYSHLQAGSPVAINPRTGVPYKEGDTVYRGDLIGYTGRTGNAYNGVPNPHLHLGASFEANDDGKIPSNSWMDVMPYINGTIDKAQLEADFGKPDKGQRDNIICD